jgi:O-antigen ligase
MSLRLYQIILAALLMALTLVTKAIQHNPIGNDYLCFLIMLLLFPCVMQGSTENISFYRITIFFACGIVSAALTAQQIATFPNISQFITVNSYLTVTRLSGFYGDPNFYSAHISACLAGIQLLLCYEKGRRNQIVLAILALILLYCGLLSASKSFIIVTACLFLLWVPILLGKGASSSRFRLFMGVLCAGIVIASSSAFQALLQIVDDRFAQASNMSELTTGRTDLWKNYIHEFLYNPITLLFGEGYTSINLNNKGSHNTLIQLVYQFGLIGIPFLVSWVVISLRNLFAQFNVGRVQWKHVLLMCVGVALPWMGIDILQFDEFFLLPIYAVIGIAYSTHSTENT